MLRSSVLFLLISASSPAQSLGSVDLSVVDRIAATGIAGVAVQLKAGNAESPAYSVLTDSSGAAHIVDVAAGEYSAFLHKEGFKTLDFEGTVAKPIHVKAGETTVLRRHLLRLAALSGKVLDSEGRPLPRVAVEILRRDQNQSTFTNGEGRYRFTDLEPGSYVVRIRNWVPAKESPVRSPAPSEGDADRPIHDLTTNSIILHSGEDLTRFDLRPSEPSIHRIRGIVLDDRGDPAAGAIVTLEAVKASHSSTPEAMVRSSKDGSFEFARVAPGDWGVLATYGRESADFRATIDASITSYDLDDLRLRLERSFTLDALLEWNKSQFWELPHGDPQVMLIAADGLSKDQYSNGTTSTQHIIDMFAGRYRISPGCPPGYYIASILFGDREVLGQEIEIHIGSPAIRVIYGADGGRLRGRVEKGALSEVIVVPKDPTLHSFEGFARCDEDGRFEISGIRPGDYYAVASNWFDFNALDFPLTLRSQASQGTSVHVGPGETVSVELSIRSSLQ